MAARAPSNTRVNPHRMNHQQIKEQEALNRERQRQDEYNKERKDKISQNLRGQYSHVESTVGKTGPKHEPVRAPQGGGGPTDDVQINVFVRECEGDDTAHMFSMMESAAQQSSPQRGGVAPQSKPTGTRPALANAGGGNVARGQSAPKATGQVARGQVPEYLQKRKAQAAAEKAAIEAQKAEEAERAKYPPGHRPMSEEERQDLLLRLNQRKKELEYDLVRIPVRIDTLAVQKRRRQVETEIEEVDSAIQKFSVKKQLFVPI